MNKSLLRRLTHGSTHPQFRHAAIVLRGGSLLATGVNRNGLHAEVHALRILWPGKRAGTTVISVRTRRDGSFAMARPCRSCWAYMSRAGVKTVIYTTWNGEWRQERI